jgi:glycosyl transferase family 25
MNHTISTKIINLEHRNDRREECSKEIALANLSQLNPSYFDAKHTPGLGARGCALSHAMCLSSWLYQEDQPFAMILEDDFSIRDHAAFLQTLEQILGLHQAWDVFLLGHNQAVPIMATNVPNLFQVANAQTTSGYIVHRTYAPKLIETFFRSAGLLSQPQLDNTTKVYLYSCDILWKDLQMKDRFYSFVPSLILQRTSFSDITQSLVDYKT